MFEGCHGDERMLEDKKKSIGPVLGLQEFTRRKMHGAEIVLPSDHLQLNLGCHAAIGIMTSTRDYSLTLCFSTYKLSIGTCIQQIAVCRAQVDILPRRRIGACICRGHG